METFLFHYYFDLSKVTLIMTAIHNITFEKSCCMIGFLILG